MPQHHPTRRRLLQAGILGLLSSALPTAMSAARASAVARTALDPASTAEQATQGIDLSGKTIVVTGCNSGIGLETMRVLALRGAHVIGTARSREKGEAACTSIRGKATPLVLDLADFDSVVVCANQVLALAPQLDGLICNAGIVLGDLEQVDGLEKQFVVNHLGHYLLTRRLLDRLIAAPQGRVVVLGSGEHRNAPPGGIQVGRLWGASWRDRGYSHSKLANGLFSLELSQQLAGTPATSNCATPGHVRSNILRNVGNGYRDDARSVQQGAATPSWLASSPTLASVSGGYFRDFAEAEQSEQQRDRAMAHRLWQVSETLVAKHLA